jgi:hypothetical protein
LAPLSKGLRAAACGLTECPWIWEKIITALLLDTAYRKEITKIYGKQIKADNGAQGRKIAVLGKLYAKHSIIATRG